MKNRIKLFEAIRMMAVIAMVAIIGFSMAACDADGGGGSTTLVVRITDNNGDPVGATVSIAATNELEVEFHTGDNQWGYWGGSNPRETKWFKNDTAIPDSDSRYLDISSGYVAGDKIKVQVTYQSRDNKGNLRSPATASAETTLTD